MSFVKFQMCSMFFSWIFYSKLWIWSIFYNDVLKIFSLANFTGSLFWIYVRSWICHRWVTICVNFVVLFGYFYILSDYVFNEGSFFPQNILLIFAQISIFSWIQSKFQIFEFIFDISFIFWSLKFIQLQELEQIFNWFLIFRLIWFLS